MLPLDVGSGNLEGHPGDTVDVTVGTDVLFDDMSGVGYMIDAYAMLSHKCCVAIIEPLKSICTLHNMEPCSLCTTSHGEAPIRSMHGQHWEPHMLLRYCRLKLEAGHRNNLVRSLLSKYNISNSPSKSQKRAIYSSVSSRNTNVL
jgi:hypothetical protein